MTPARDAVVGGRPPHGEAGPEIAARRGILLMVLTMLVFAAQDGISKHLAERYSVIFITMIRYWFFAVFVIALTARRAGGLSAAARTRFPLLQSFRGALLAFQICVMVSSFATLGLVESHSVFVVYPLLVTALAGPLLGERIGWRRWTAVGAGFVGVLIILRPGLQVFDPLALIPLGAAAMFAGYHLATRYVSRVDGSTTSFFYTGVAGAAAITLVGPFFWTPMVGWDWAWMGLLCLSGMSGHYLLISALESAEASVVQPFTYLQLVFASLVGVAVFGERMDAATVLGAAIIVGAGLFAIWRERVRTRRG